MIPQNIRKQYPQLLSKLLRRYKSTQFTNSNNLKPLKPSTSGRQRRQIKDDGQTLEDFLLKNNTMKMYREMLRAIRKVPDKTTQIELIGFIKDDFRSAKDITDKELKSSLLNSGMRKFNQLATMMQLALPEIKFKT